jgi:uncharacterized membrane protein YdbT with pleckstrin-like domain
MRFLFRFSLFPAFSYTGHRLVLCHHFHSDQCALDRAGDDPLATIHRSIEYEMGEEELVVRRGIITKSEATVPYRTVTNIDVKRGPLDRMLGISGLHIHTAGYSGQESSAEATLVGLREYEGILTELRAALHRYRARTGVAVGFDEVEEPAGAPTEVVLHEILAELRALRRHVEQS